MYSQDDGCDVTVVNDGTGVKLVNWLVVVIEDVWEERLEPVDVNDVIETVVAIDEDNVHGIDVENKSLLFSDDVIFIVFCPS